MKIKKRIYQIDLFRFLAALSVVLYHYLFKAYNADDVTSLNFIEIGGFFKYGYLGVNLFFIISGFVISLSIKNRSSIKFLISRVSRLYPVYWICVLLTFIVIILFGTQKYTADFIQFLLNLTMFQNYISVENIDGVYWTLFVEMKFYIFIIGLYLILNKVKQIKFDNLILIWTLLSVIYVFLNELYFFKIINYFFILNWSSYFIAGMTFYQVYKNRLTLKYSLIIIISLFISLYHGISRIDSLEIALNTSFSPYIIGIIITLFYLLMLLVSNNKLNKINSSKLTKLGMLTYPLYLIHQKIGLIIFNNIGNYLNKYLLVISTIIFMIILSFIMSEFYEPRAVNFLKSKLEYFATKYKLQFKQSVKNYIK